MDKLVDNHIFSPPPPGQNQAVLGRVAACQEELAGRGGEAFHGIFAISNQSLSLRTPVHALRCAAAPLGRWLAA